MIKLVGATELVFQLECFIKVHTGGKNLIHFTYFNQEKISSKKLKLDDQRQNVNSRSSQKNGGGLLNLWRKFFFACE